MFYGGSPISSDMELKLMVVPMQWKGPCNAAVFDLINMSLIIAMVTACSYMF